MQRHLSHDTEGPLQRGPFFARRALLQGLVLLALGSGGVAAHASSFDDFFRAIASDSPRVIQDLAARGFDLNTRNEKFEPPLWLALRAGSLRVADLLIARPEVDVELRNAQDESALMMAALKGHLAQAQALIRRGAHVNKPGWTPLHYAATADLANAPALVALMLEHHAYIDAVSPNGSTPLMLAAMYGNAKVVPQLLEAGADPTLKNQQGLSAVDFAQRAGRTSEAERVAAAIRARAPKGRW